MIVDIFHGQLSLDDFEDAIYSYTFVSWDVGVDDMVTTTYRDSIGNDHTYVFPYHSQACDVWHEERGRVGAQ